MTIDDIIRFKGNNPTFLRKVIFLVDYILRTWLISFIIRSMPSNVVPFLHRIRGVRLGKGCLIHPTAFLDSTFPEKIKLGNRVYIATNSCIIAHFHSTPKLKEYYKEDYVQDVEIGDEVFIGPNVTILPGTRIGEVTLIVAGAVVSQSIPPFSVVAGNPARLINSLREKVSE